MLTTTSIKVKGLSACIGCMGELNAKRHEGANGFVIPCTVRENSTSVMIKFPLSLIHEVHIEPMTRQICVTGTARTNERYAKTLLKEIETNTALQPQHPKLMEILSTNTHAPWHVSVRYDGTVEDILTTPFAKRMMHKDPQRLANDLTEGILYMHSHNVAHRDLKPENVFFDKAKQTFVIGDLGGCCTGGIFEWNDGDTTSVVGAPPMTLPLMLPREASMMEMFPAVSDVYGFLTIVQSYILGRHIVPECDRNRRGVGRFYAPQCDDELYRQLEVIREGILRKKDFRLRQEWMDELTFIAQQPPACGMYSEFLSLSSFTTELQQQPSGDQSISSIRRRRHWLRENEFDNEPRRTASLNQV